MVGSSLMGTKMNKFIVFFISLILLTLVGCNRGGKINGHTTRTALRSVKMLKNRLPTRQKIAFELSFWTARDAIKDTDEFLDTVDGKTPQEIIDLGKQLFSERKAAGFAAYEKFATWDEMITNYEQERADQELPRRRRDPRDNHSVLYKL